MFCNHLCFQVAFRSGQVQIQEVYAEVKNFFKPARLLGREFLFVPVYLPGHWAVSVVCRPLALVRELLGLVVDEGNRCARVSPSIIYADSMGSKGLFFRLALARVLVQHYLESNPVNGTLALQLSDSELKAKLGPEVSTPNQGDTFSCADNTLHTSRRFIVEVVLPSLAHWAGDAGGAGEMPLICVESIMTSNWFTRDDVLKERHYLKEVVTNLKLNPVAGSVTGSVSGNQQLSSSSVGSNGAQVPEKEAWDVYCDEIATKQELMLRERKLTADVMQLLASFQVHTASGNSNGSSCKPITQQVSVFLFSALQLVGP